jgi:YjbR protein
VRRPKPLVHASVSTRQWDAVRAFALSFPAAVEDFPWGESIIKVEKRGIEPPSWRRGLAHGPMFLWLGRRDTESHAIRVKLTASYEQAVAMAGAIPTSASGLGQWGWLTVPLAVVELDLVYDWVDESYRNVAPKKRTAGKARRRPAR